jgi:hypothetical protein
LPARDARLHPVAPARCPQEDQAMTFVWFVIWLIANNVGAHEPLLLEPVNAWTATLILAVALDLGAAHARS